MRCLYLVVIVGFWGMKGVAGEADEPGNRKAWKLLAGHSASKAWPLFNHAPLSSERQLGMAAALLGKYPQTQQNVDRAEVVLQTLLRGSDRTELHAPALYLLARIEHIFREGHESQAEVYYRVLLKKHPESQWADYAAVKLALIVLDRLPGKSDTNEVRSMIAGLAEPRRSEARSNWHRLIAEYLLEHGDMVAALDHLILVRKLAEGIGKNRADLLVQLGNVATRLNEGKIAISAYEEFLIEFARDNRNFMVQREVRRIRREEEK